MRPVLYLCERPNLETPSFDPLQHRVELPLDALLHPLGYPLHLTTNAAEVIDAARESWALFEPAFAERPIELRVAVSTDERTALPPPPVFRAQGHLLSIISDSANFAVCDCEAGFAYCWLSPGAARARTWVRHYFLDAIAYIILSHQHLTAIHAACVMKNGCGVLLCGGTGAGKTSLSYACARAGWTYLSDDASFLLRRSPEATVLGKPHQLRFLENAEELFPELASRPVLADANGARRIELRPSEIPGIQTAARCTAGALVFLRRGDGGPDLLPISRAEARRRLLAELPVYEAGVYAEHKASIERLLDLEPHEFRYHDLSRAVPALEALVRERVTPCS